MSLEQTSTPSRRTLLAALAGGLAATAAGALGRPDRALAGGGIGGDNVTSDTTRITNDAASNLADNDHGLVASGKFNGAGLIGIGGSQGGVGVIGESEDTNGVRGVSFSDAAAVLGRSQDDNTGVQGFSTFGTSTATPASPAKTGVYGYAAQDSSARGVTGQTTTGRGVFGIATSGIGVAGQSLTGQAVSGITGANNQPAVLGRANGDNTGVQGFSGAGVDPVASPTKTGVFGYAVQDANARGVIGQTTLGRGVEGIATTGRGVHGSATTGIGVFATATTTSGRALQVAGRVMFSTAGIAHVLAGANSVTVTPGIFIDSDHRILCTLESSQASLFIRRFTRDIGAHTFTVFLNTTRAANKYARVQWFVIG